MKKLITALFTLTLIVSMSILASCGGAPSNEQVEKIIEKYDEEKLSPSDYQTLITYVDTAIDKATELFKARKKAEKNDDYDTLDRLEDEFDELNDRYEYYSKALRIIRRASDDELGSASSNAKKLLKKERRFEEKY